MASNQPRRWMVKDDILCQIARLRPQTSEALARLRGTDAAGATLARPAHTAEQEILLELLSAVVRLQAAKHGLNPATLASRKDLEQLRAPRTLTSAVAGAGS